MPRALPNPVFCHSALPQILHPLESSPSPKSPPNIFLVTQQPRCFHLLHLQSFFPVIFFPPPLRSPFTCDNQPQILHLQAFQHLPAPPRKLSRTLSRRLSRRLSRTPPTHCTLRHTASRRGPEQWPHTSRPVDWAPAAEAAALSPGIARGAAAPWPSPVAYSPGHANLRQFWPLSINLRPFILFQSVLNLTLSLSSYSPKSASHPLH